MVLLLVATGVLSITGWKGAEAVYRYGLGVISMPNSDARQQNPTDGHNHSHDEAPKTESDEKGKSIQKEETNHSKHSHKADAKKAAVKNADSSKVKEQSSKQEDSEEEENNHENHSH